MITEISETCRDALSSGDSAVLAVPDHWTEAQCEEFKNIFEQVSKVRSFTGGKCLKSFFSLQFKELYHALLPLGWQQNRMVIWVI